MKVGGNSSFSDFLVKHPGAYSSSSSDTKAKYTSKAAELYRDELKRRSLADEAQFGPRVVVAGEAGAGALSPGSNASGKKDDDFFDSWNKPNLVKPPPQQAAVVRPPGIGNRSPALTPNGSQVGTPRSGSPASAAATSPPPSAPTLPAQPRTISSNSLRGGATGSTAGAGRSKLGATRVGGGLGATKGKLGAKKAGAPLDFEEAERKAKEEEERVKQLGYDRRAEEAEAAAALAASAAANASSSANRAASNSNGSASAAGYTHTAKKPSIDDDRLGMGFRRLGFGQVSGMSGAESAALADKQKREAAKKASGYVEPEVGNQARDRFGGQKGVHLRFTMCGTPR